MFLFLQHDLWSKLIAASNFKVESPLYFPGSCSQQKGLSPDYNPQRRVSWALLYLFDHIWDSAVQFRPLVKGMCHPNWLHTPLLSVPILPRTHPPFHEIQRWKFHSSSQNTAVLWQHFFGFGAIEVWISEEITSVLWLVIVAIAAHQSGCLWLWYKDSKLLRNRQWHKWFDWALMQIGIWLAHTKMYQQVSQIKCQNVLFSSDWGLTNRETALLVGWVTTCMAGWRTAVVSGSGGSAGLGSREIC